MEGEQKSAGVETMAAGLSRICVWVCGREADGDACLGSSSQVAQVSPKWLIPSSWQWTVVIVVGKVVLISKPKDEASLIKLEFTVFPLKGKVLVADHTWWKP